MLVTGMELWLKQDHLNGIFSSTSWKYACGKTLAYTKMKDATKLKGWNIFSLSLSFFGKKSRLGYFPSSGKTLQDGEDIAESRLQVAMEYDTQNWSWQVKNNPWLIHNKVWQCRKKTGSYSLWSAKKVQNCIGTTFNHSTNFFQSWKQVKHGKKIDHAS